MAPNIAQNMAENTAENMAENMAEKTHSLDRSLTLPAVKNIQLINSITLSSPYFFSTFQVSTMEPPHRQVT